VTPPSCRPCQAASGLIGQQRGALADYPAVKRAIPFTKFCASEPTLIRQASSGLIPTAALCLAIFLVFFIVNIFIHGAFSAHVCGEVGRGIQWVGSTGVNSYSFHEPVYSLPVKVST
jgi:hypothetical protein